jgi:signal transduction histidine kinase
LSEYLELLAPLEGRKKAPLRANYSIANYLKTDSKAMVTQILDTLIENAVNHSKMVATEIIDGFNMHKYIVIIATNVDNK